MVFVEINNENFRDFWKLSVFLKQKKQVANNTRILARAYAYRNFKPVVYGIVENSKPVGLMFYRNYHKNNEKVKYLDQLMIDKKFQNKGLGTLAVQKLIDILKNEKVKQLHLCYIDGHNDVLKFYEKLGFKKTGNNDEDEIEMVLDIN